MFGTSGIRGPVGETVTASLALDVGRAVASEGADRVVVGRDPRESGLHLTDALAAGLCECGADVVDVGLAATPTVARAVAWRDADAGVSVTASHNPAPDNGIKLWQADGQAYDAERRAAIESRLEDRSFSHVDWDEIGTRTAWDGPIQRHADALVDAVTIESPLRVAVDVGNGAGGVTASALQRLGCAVEVLNGQPDGTFPARPSEPTAENCATLANLVAADGYDLGVAHDGDADRLMAVDETGSFLAGDVLLALFGRDAAGEGERVAAPLNTSLAVDDALAEVGASLVRTRVGDVFVAERTREPDVVFGGEPSGAWIWPEQTRCPDGPLAACRLAAMVARDGPLSAQAESVPEYPLRRESVEVLAKGEVMERVAAAVGDRYEDVETTDGVRVDLGDAWFLIRASGTQPLVRLTAEAKSPERADELLETARELVETAR